MRRKTRGFIVLATVALLPIAAAPTQAATPDEAGPQVIVVGPNTPGVVHKGDATFYPTPGAGPDDLVVVLDANGRTPGGLSIDEFQEIATERAAAKAAGNLSTSSTIAGDGVVAPQWACNGVSYGAAPYVWSGAYQYCRGVIGMNSSVKVAYRFDVTAETMQRAQGQGIGYWTGYNGSQLGTWEKWYSLGIADDTVSGSAGGEVPWGNVAGTPQFKAKSLQPFVAVGFFYAN